MENKKTSIFIHIFFVAFSLACLLPVIMVVSASISSETSIRMHGFTLWPKELDFVSYEFLFANPKQIIDGYKVTIFTTVMGTFLTVLFSSAAAYALARPTCKFKGIATAFLFFPTLFSGGLVPSYIIYTQYYHLTDSIWVLILPGLINCFNVFMIRTFFKQLPAGLFDAAQIDGASELKIYFTIALRLSKPVLATVAFLDAKGRWNEWNNAMIYIRSDEKYTLQYLLQRMIMDINELRNRMEKMPSIMVEQIPGENLRMALLVVCIGPMMLIFPFFQKYFTKGMMVGSIKG